MSRSRQSDTAEPATAIVYGSPAWHRIVAANARRLAALLMAGAADCPLCDLPEHPHCEDCDELHRRAAGFLRRAELHDREANRLEVPAVWAW